MKNLQNFVYRRNKKNSIPILCAPLSVERGGAGEGGGGHQGDQEVQGPHGKGTRRKKKYFVRSSELVEGGGYGIFCLKINWIVE